MQSRGVVSNNVHLSEPGVRVSIASVTSDDQLQWTVVIVEPSSASQAGCLSRRSLTSIARHYTAFRWRYVFLAADWAFDLSSSQASSGVCDWCSCCRMWHRNCEINVHMYFVLSAPCTVVIVTVPFSKSRLYEYEFRWTVLYKYVCLLLVLLSWPTPQM